MHIIRIYLAATDTTDERTLEAFEEDGVLLMAEEDDSKILRSHIGDKPSHTLLLLVITELPSWLDELWPNPELKLLLRPMEGEEGDGNEEEDEVDWLLHSNTSPGFKGEWCNFDPEILLLFSEYDVNLEE